MRIWNLWAAGIGFHSVIKTLAILATDVAHIQSSFLHFVERFSVESSSTAPRTKVVAGWHPKDKSHRILIDLHGC